MSQLDISMYYSHLFGLILFFYLLIHYINKILILFLYNENLRLMKEEELFKISNTVNKTFIIKKILNL